MRKLLAILLFSLFCTPAVAELMNAEALAISHQLNALTLQNDAAPKRLALLTEKLQQQVSDTDLLQPKVEAQASISHQLAEADLRRLEAALQDNLQNRAETDRKIRHLQELYQKWQVSKLPREIVKEKLARFQTRLSDLNTQLSLQDQYSKALKISVDNAKLTLQIYENYRHDLHKSHELIHQKERIKQLRLRNQHSHEEQKLWVNELQQQLELTSNPEATLPEKIQAQTTIFYLQERIKLSKIAINYNTLQENLADLFDQTPSENTLQAVEADLPQVQSAIAELNTMLDHIQSKKSLMNEHQSIIQKSLAQKIITEDVARAITTKLTELQQIRETLLQSLTTLHKRVTAYQTSLEAQLTHIISQQHGLPTLNLKAWLDFPLAAFQLLESLTSTITQAFIQLTSTQQLLLFAIELAVFTLLYYSRRILKSIKDTLAEQQSRTTLNALYIGAELLWRNFAVLGAGFVFWVLVLFLNLPFKFYSTVVYLWLVWFGFYALIGLARLLLMERISDESGRDVRLYYRLKWTLIGGAVITGATVLSHQLYLHYSVLNIMNRLLLLFLLAVALVLWRARDLAPALIAPLIDERRRYLYHAMMLLAWLIPLSLIANAFIGLAGYLDLAKTMGYYELIFVVSLTIYVILRGIILDSLDLLSEAAIRHLKNGWLLTEGLLKPLDRILRLVLLTSMLILTLMLMGVTSQSPWLGFGFRLLHYPIFTFSGGKITVTSAIAFTFTAAFAVWLGRWSRELSYRWLFRNEEDLAARKSFSAFMQYGILTVGSLISLRVLGFDFAGLSMILGGLAVGLGLALRDLVSNIVSGIMMLIERPVREGDLISLDNFEGEVTHIGFRAIRIRSWDHMDVMIPNTEAFNKSFTNWTLADSIVRTVVKIKVHREDNAEAVKRILDEAVRELEEVLVDPEPQVLLWEISDALIEFEVRYFINLQRHSRHLTRSKVLLHLDSKLKASGIRPPYAPQELYLKS